MNRLAAQSSTTRKKCRTTRISATTFSFTNTSMATMAGASGQRIKPVGPASWPTSSNLTREDFGYERRASSRSYQALSGRQVFAWAIRKSLLAIGIERSFALNRRGLVEQSADGTDERRLKTTSNRVAAVPMSSRFMPAAWLARALGEGHQQLSNASPDIAVRLGLSFSPSA